MRLGIASCCCGLVVNFEEQYGMPVLCSVGCMPIKSDYPFRCYWWVFRGLGGVFAQVTLESKRVVAEEIGFRGSVSGVEGLATCFVGFFGSETE